MHVQGRHRRGDDVSRFVINREMNQRDVDIRMN